MLPCLLTLRQFVQPSTPRSPPSGSIVTFLCDRFHVGYCNQQPATYSGNQNEKIRQYLLSNLWCNIEISIWGCHESHILWHEMIPMLFCHIKKLSSTHDEAADDSMKKMTIFRYQLKLIRLCRRWRHLDAICQISFNSTAFQRLMIYLWTKMLDIRIPLILFKYTKGNWCACLKYSLSLCCCCYYLKEGTTHN